MNAPTTAMDQVRVCTVLPTYNERANITPLIDGIMQGAITPHRVLVVDDDSPDGTWQVVETLAEQRAGDVVLIRRQEAKGLTSAIQRGIDEAIETCDATSSPGWIAIFLCRRRTFPGWFGPSWRGAPMWPSALAGRLAATTRPTGGCPAR